MSVNRYVFIFIYITLWVFLDKIGLPGKIYAQKRTRQSFESKSIGMAAK